MIRRLTLLTHRALLISWANGTVQGDCHLLPLDSALMKIFTPLKCTCGNDMA